MNRRKPVLFLALAALLFLLSRVFGWSQYFTQGEGLDGLRSLAQSHLLAAALLYLAFCAVACVVLALPGVAFAVIAGALFGPWLGSVLCLIGTTVGAVLSFLAGRYFLKDAMRPKVLASPLLRKVLLGDKQHSAALLLMITRLLPVFPFNLQNFAYGITDIGVVKYTLYTFVFMTPGVFFFTLTTAGILTDAGMGLFWAAGGALVVLAAAGMGAKAIYRKKYD